VQVRAKCSGNLDVAVFGGFEEGNGAADVVGLLHVDLWFLQNLKQILQSEEELLLAGSLKNLR
jgi:hypothetical protein